MAVGLGDLPVLAGTITAVTTGIFGVLSVFLTQRGQRETERLKAQAPQWDSFVRQMQQWTENRIADLQEEIDRLKKDFDQLNATLDVVRAKYEVSLKHIRDLRATSKTASEQVPMPEVLRHDIAVLAPYDESP